MKIGKFHEPYNKLKGKLRELGLTYEDVSDTLGISATAVGFKISGRSDFFLSEVEKLMEEYSLEMDIFLNDKLRIRQQ